MAVFVSNIVIEQGFTFSAAFELENTETDWSIGYEWIFFIV